MHRSKAVAPTRSAAGVLLQFRNEVCFGKETPVGAIGYTLAPRQKLLAGDARGIVGIGDHLRNSLAGCVHTGLLLL